MYACNGLPLIMSHRAGETFVAKDHPGLAVDGTEVPFMGNLDALRDWGHARDYEMQWRMLQQEKAEDFGSPPVDRNRCAVSLGSAGALDWGPISWEGGLEEIGRRSDTGAIVVKIDPRYFRPAEVETLLGDPTRAREKLGWTPATSLEELVTEMISKDREDARKEAYLKRKGFNVVGPRE